MKIKFAQTLGAFAALALTALRAFAADLPPVAPILEGNLAGLQVSLTTSGYKFFLAETAPPTAAVAPATKAARESFVASALVANRSTTDIAFTFPNPAAAQSHWTFRVFNAAGEQLWESDGDVISAQVMTDAKLVKRGRWKRLVQVPLRMDGKLLAPGFYRLEASIDADKSLSASALFEVALPPLTPVSDTNTGIKGAVLLPGDGDAPAASALINIMEIRSDAVPLNRPPFVWSGRADALGKFQVVTPAGRYRVTASALSGTTPSSGAAQPIPLPKTVEVTVATGTFTEVTIRLVNRQAPLPPTPVGL